MKPSEIRQNKVSRQWVIYSPARRKRPRDFGTERKNSVLASHDENCPFCPGNERMLPPVVSERKDENDAWKVRVVPNKFPALTPAGGLARSTRGIYLSMQGHGRHEVVIESPLHNRQIGTMSLSEVEGVIEMYHSRYIDLMAEEENMMITIFRNHGPRAGTSLIHPHSQIIATGMVPHHVRWREEEAQYYYDDWGRCIYCDIVAQEQKDRVRLVCENRSFTAFVPFAAEVPFEVWIMPAAHRADFGAIADAEKADLAAVLHHVLGRLHLKLDDPDYNYIINAPVRYRSGEPQLHWYLQIRPRLMTAAGFEIGSGISINPSIPEDDAAFLRSE